MKKALLLFLIVFASVNLFASHFQGYDITLQNYQNDYKLILKIYRDNRASSAAMPSSATLSLRKNSDNAKVGPDLLLNRTMLYNASYESNQNCMTPDANTNLQVGFFECIIPSSQASTLNNASGYYLSGNLCCRNAEVTNIENTSSYGVQFTMDFPRLSLGATTILNSSPKFNEDPLLIYIVGKNYSINWSATDADGDSLVYSLTKPLDDGSNIKPFYEIEYKSGYGIGINLTDGDPDFSLNPSSGMITYKPTMAGSYIVAVKVEEFRNGVKIGEIRREMQLLTVITFENPPVVSNIFDDVNDIIDTIDFPNGYTQEYSLKFKAKDYGDSLSMYAMPNISIGENLFDPNTFKAEFGEVGNTQTGSAALYPVGMKKDSVLAEFKWNVSSFMGRENPYSLQVFAKDKTCPYGLTDTINIKLYVNYKRCFVNDTLMTDATGCDSVVLALNNGIKTFYADTTIIDTIPQQFNCDLIKTYLIRVREGTDEPSVSGDVNITDTSMIYTYEAITKNDVVQYEWLTSPSGVIVGGDASQMIHVKWNSIGQENLKLIVYNRDNCSDSTDVLVNVTHIVGIEQSRNNSFQIFPNPTKDKIFIKSTGDNSLITELYSIEGKLLLTSTSNEIDISSFSNGIYLLKIGGYVERIIKM